MITVCCVYWGTKFSEKYVYNLKSMVEKNTTVPHRFVVLADRGFPGIETIYLEPGYEGWWNKLQLFNSKHRLGSRVVYLDLDTVIVSNIDWLLKDTSRYMAIEDLGSINEHQPYLKGRMQSAVISMNYYANNHIWDDFVQDSAAMKVYRGDGEYLHDKISPINKTLIQHFYPGKVKSYKYQVYPGPPDDQTSIICFHGRPSIQQAMEETIKTSRDTYEPQTWIKDYWK